MTPPGDRGAQASLADREAEASVRNRPSSIAQEQIDESRAMNNLNGRIQQLTKLILTNATGTQQRQRQRKSAY